MSYQILPDINGDIARWICKGLNFDTEWLGENLTFGFAFDNKMVGGLIFHDLRFKQDVWWTIYSDDKHWCNRTMLRQMFDLAFNKMQCRRINILVNTDNFRCLNFVKRIGFKIEGLLRKFRQDGADCYFLGMLREECLWLNSKGEKNE